MSATIRDTRLLGCAAALFGAAALAPPAARAADPLIPLWEAPAIERHCAGALDQARARVAALRRAPAGADAASVYSAWDRLQIGLEDVRGPTELLANVSPDPATRSAADACQLKLTVFSTDLYQDAVLYRRISDTAPGDAIDRKLKKDITEAFEDTGVALPPARRARVKAILQRLEEIQQTFARNIRDNTTRVRFTPDEMKGLPAAYLARAKRDDKGDYLLGFEYPQYVPFMANAENEPARRRYYVAFMNRGTPQNLTLLAEAARLRHEMANLYGLPSYARFVTRRRMVGNPQTVLRFLAEVKGKVREVEAAEIAQLRELKAKRLGTPVKDTAFGRWDLSYYLEQMRKARYDVDQEALRAYFPTDAVIEWALGVASDLYGVRFERKTVPVWHPTVRYYRVLDARSGAFLGGIYLDLIPREGKYSHAAAFGVRSVSVLAHRTPISALVANLDPKGLDQRELETIMHEFGHVLHGVLSRTRYASEGGTNVELDFVEAPSQMFEEWARTREPLERIHRYCTGCPKVDDALVARLHAARAFGQGVFYSRQHLYASFDMALFGRRDLDPMQVWKEMEGETPLGYLPGTQFPGTFAHLVSGYGAGYYGYMWSEVLALDMLSVFGAHPMNAKAGRRFRARSLSQGGQAPAATLVRRFLGRKPSPKAFFEEITGRRPG